jgi:hypothetical protein
MSGLDRQRVVAGSAVEERDEGQCGRQCEGIVAVAAAEDDLVQAACGYGVPDGVIEHERVCIAGDLEKRDRG